MEYLECKYRLPCGWCDRTQEKCIYDAVCEDKRKECAHHWVWDTLTLSYKCVKCGEVKYRGHHD